MPFETFDSRMGKISVRSAPYCEGCGSFLNPVDPEEFGVRLSDLAY